MGKENKAYMIAMDVAGYTYYIEQEKLPLALAPETWTMAWTANFFFGALFETEESAKNFAVLVQQNLSISLGSYVFISVIEAPSEDEYLDYLEDEYRAQFDG